MPVTQRFGQREAAGDQIKPAHPQLRGLNDEFSFLIGLDINSNVFVAYFPPWVDRDSGDFVDLPRQRQAGIFPLCPGSDNRHHGPPDSAC